MARFQRGSVRVESRKNGSTWVLRYFVTRPSDSRRVEHNVQNHYTLPLPDEEQNPGCQHVRLRAYIQVCEGPGE
jgi:hypothetical protein